MKYSLRGNPHKPHLPFIRFSLIGFFFSKEENQISESCTPSSCLSLLVHTLGSLSLAHNTQRIYNVSVSGVAIQQGGPDKTAT